MSKEKKLKAAEDARRKREDAEFDARYNAKLEIKNVEKYVKSLNCSIETLMQKAVEAKQAGLDKSFQQIATQIKVLKLRQKQAQAFMFQYDVMLAMKDVSSASVDFLKSMNVIINSFGGMNFAKDEILASQKSLAKSNSNLEKQTMMIDNVLDAFDSIGFGDEADANSNGLDISDVERDVMSRIGGVVSSNSNSAATASPVLDSAVQDAAKAEREIAEIRKKLNTY